MVAFALCSLSGCDDHPPELSAGAAGPVEVEVDRGESEGLLLEALAAIGLASSLWVAPALWAAWQNRRGQ